MSFDVKKKIEELNKSDIISGSNARYDIVLEEELKDLNSAGIILRHKKSGARVVVISNDDNNKVFSIGFKTPPFNDTGMQHIIEHSTLCGSRKYPVKDPFVELCKGSLNTFLNAMTYPDKTVYPVASCNDTDFKNIMDVYMDAVFYPAMYEKPEIFMQEGWHYELDNADDDIKYNGVVFNEMKGAFSSPDDVLSRYTFVSLFPDTVYKNESGGDPEVIPTLKYEDFLKYHEEYYHPSNSYIYIYGDMDVNERLEYLDSEYLSDFDVSDVDIHANIERQAAFDKPVYETKPYAITEDESLEDNTYLSYNAVIGTSVDAKLYLAFQILDYALVMTPGAPVKQALLDAGISTDVYSSYETSLYQPVYSIVAKNSNSKEQGRFVSVINDTLEKLVKDGINERTIEAGINYYEFKYREADYGPYPKGLMYYLTMMDSWLYDETKPFIHIEAGDTFDELKKDARNGYFEKLIKEYLLDNNHKSIISLVPEYGLEKEKEQKEADKLAEYKSTLTNDELEELVKKTKELGMDSIAITDHGVMYGCVEFYKAAKAEGIKPIIGCEVYVASKSRFDKENSPDNFYYHLVLLAENNKGYDNLIKIVSYGFKDGFYYKPRVDIELLEKYHEGIIALSACLAGPVARTIIRQGYDKAKEVALRYNNIFGENNFFLELQDHMDGSVDQQTVNQSLMRMHQETGIPLVATNDCHYISPEDAEAHDILLCIQTNTTVDEADRMRYEGGQYYVKSPEEMYSLFPYAHQACENTYKIAQRCNVEFEFGNYKLPVFDVPDGKTAVEYLSELALNGLKERYGEVTPKLKERLDYELSIIIQMGFVDYFLIVWDFIKYAKDNGISVGPGRGSAAGSIVAYSLRITDIDPIKYDLIFERFLNPERVSMPDIDIDFCYERRGEVIDYVRRKYGNDQVVQIVTFGTMAARNAIRDVGRALNLMPMLTELPKWFHRNFTLLLKKLLLKIRNLRKYTTQTLL